ncbi:hypothetical protein LTR10_012199 [Elasticomyces elasticus]|nr:hypothetical protein LTR10_012199 [Elasticomyces elasticus]KAK4965679.1 hypothetical protein LTR42_011692 [Elasticomyces elasticus]
MGQDEVPRGPPPEVLHPLQNHVEEWLFLAHSTIENLIGIAASEQLVCWDLTTCNQRFICFGNAHTPEKAERRATFGDESKAGEWCRKKPCSMLRPYCQEAMVVGVEDEEFGQRVAAAVTLTEDIYGLSLGDLRANLRNKLPGYKLLTVLRVMASELPKDATGKVQKKILGPQYFPAGRWRSENAVQVWGARMPDARPRP